MELSENMAPTWTYRKSFKGGLLLLLGLNFPAQRTKIIKVIKVVIQLNINGFF